MANARANIFELVENHKNVQAIAQGLDCWLSRYGQALSLMAIAALSIGLGLTQYFHGRIAALRTTTDILKIEHGVIAENKYHLERIDAQIGSRAQIMTIAQRKLKLIEPEQRQLQQLKITHPTEL